MFCTKCGAQLNDDARFCTNCGAVTETAQPQPQTQPQQPVPPPPPPPQPQQYAPPPQPQPQQYAPPAYAVPGPQPVPPQYGAPAVPPAPKKKRRVGCLIVLIVFLVLIGAGFFVFAKFAWMPPRDLGIRYTQADFDSAVQKVGLRVSYKDMGSNEMTEFIDEHAGEKFLIDDYNWEFSNFEERKFELTSAEATAFANEFLPLWSWFDKVQIKGRSDGSSAGSYQVHFDKIKQELIPDVVDQIPPAVSNLLPDTFNLFLDGSFEIRENEASVPEKLDRLTVGVVPLQPIIGDVSDSDREMIYNYVERLFKQIDGLVIHSLEVNSKGNFAISAYMPTLLTITDKK